MSHPEPDAAPAAMPPHLQMMQMAMGNMRMQAIAVAARLGIADLLADGPRSVDELSRASDAHAPSLYRLLRTLASIGIFAEQDDGRFALTPLAATLQSKAPNSLHPLFVLVSEPFHWSAWGNLLQSIKTGECAFEHVNGMRFFEHLGQHPDEEAAFDAWMTRTSEITNPALVSSYDFSSLSTVIDVGGGQGALLAAILKANPHLQGILFDRREVIEATQMIQAASVSDRCRLMAGNFFETVPSGGDLYVLKMIIHDWDDELSIKLLSNCRAAMNDGARLLVIESVVPLGNEAHPSKFMDLNMLVLNHGGRERTAAEYTSLFAAAGFRLTRIIATPSPMSLIEGERA